jgi:hypothetical protein
LNNCPVYWIDPVRGGKSVLTPYVASVSEFNNDFIKRYFAGFKIITAITASTGPPMARGSNCPIPTGLT